MHRNDRLQARAMARLNHPAGTGSHKTRRRRSATVAWCTAFLGSLLAIGSHGWACGVWIIVVAGALGAASVLEEDR